MLGKTLDVIGRVPERSKGTDCNSVGHHAFEGSNPSPTTKL